MKKFLQWLSVFVPMVLIIVAFSVACVYYGEYVALVIFVGTILLFVGLIAGAISSSIYADKQLKDDNTHLW